MSNSSTGQWITSIVGYIVGVYTGQWWMFAGGLLSQAQSQWGPQTKLSGPRLSDTSVQTSTYGAVLPRVHGTVALKGNVFWVEGNKLKEKVRKKKSGGKGGGGGSTVETYTYYATFAVGLCDCPSGPIAGVRRIWTLGKLYYDAGSDDQETMAASNAAATGFKVYYGTEDQMPDPRMEADRGVGNVPGYRGRAYIVFYDFPLRDYGNSIPGVQLKVEVVMSGEYASGDTVLLMHMDGGASDACGHTVSVDQTILDNEWIQFDSQKGPFGGFADFTGMVASGSATPIPPRAIVVANSTDFEIGDADFTLEATASGTTWPVQGTAYVASYGLSPTQPDLHAFQLRYNHAGLVDFVSNGPDGGFGVQSAEGAIDPYAVNRFAVTRRNGVGYLFANGIKIGQNALPGYIRNAGGNSVNYPDMYIGSNFQGYLRVDMVDEVRLIIGMALYTDDYTPLPIPADAWGFQRLTHDSAVLGDIVLAECLQCGLLTVDDLDVSGLTDTVRGYRIAQVGSIRSAIEPLQMAYPFDIVQSGYKIKFVRRGGASVASIPMDVLDARPVGEAPGEQLRVSREMDTQLPRLVRVAHIDYERDYDDGSQASPERINTASINVRDVEIPVVMTAAEAAQTAEVLAGMAWMERHDISFKLPPEYSWHEPADVVTLVGDGESHEVILGAINYLPDGRLECSAKYNSASVFEPVSPGEPGTVPPPTTIGLPGPSVAEVLDIPALATDMDTPCMLGAMTGFTTGWPGGVLYRSGDGGQTWSDVQGFIDKCTLGYARNAIGSQPAERIDITSVLQVDMYGGEPESVTLLAMLNGANYFAYGAHGRWEIIAARTVALQADGSYSLSDMLRGRFGTEHNRGNHQVGDALVLLTDIDIAFLAQDTSSIGLSRLYRAVTSGADIDSASDVALAYGAVNLKPLSPVYAKANQDRTTGDWSISWLRRTRIGGEWRDLVDASLGESAEAYEIDICDSAFASVKRTISVTSPTANYTAAQQVADFGAEQETLYLRVYQISAVVGRGYALQVTLSQPPLYWTPNLIATQLWLDAADSGSITLTSGAVSQWNDKSGNARHVTQGTAANRPAYQSAAVNGLSAINFDGVNDRLTRSTVTGLAQNVGALSIFAVVDSDVVPTTYDDFVFISTNTTSSIRALLGFNSSGGIRTEGRRLDGDAYDGVDTSSTATTSPNQFAATLSYSAAACYLFKDGAQLTSNTSFQTAGSTSNTAPAAISIGGGLADGFGLDGLMCEVIVTHSVDATQRQLIEGYLAHKWGITANLPSDHPYKTSPPEA